MKLESINKRWPTTIAILVIMLLQLGCATKIKCPKADGGKKVVLVDHGYHPSLILPLDSQQSVRYAYGNWNYYALEKNGLWDGARALFWPSPSGLGRKVFVGKASSVPEGYEQMHELEIQPEKVQNFIAKIEALYQENLQSRHINHTYGLEFVHHPESYWIFHNSNQVMGEWLVELGCEVTGSRLFSNWLIEQF